MKTATLNLRIDPVLKEAARIAAAQERQHPNSQKAIYVRHVRHPQSESTVL